MRATLHKVLLPYFKSLPGFNAYAMEMLMHTAYGPLQQIGNEVWGKNIEIDLLQENRNKDIRSP